MAHQRQVDEASRRFRQTIEHAPIGMGITAIDGAWLQVNPALCRLFGYSEPELLVRNFRETTHHDDLPGEEALMAEALASPAGSYEIEKRCVRRTAR